MPKKREENITALYLSFPICTRGIMILTSSVNTLPSTTGKLYITARYYQRNIVTLRVWAAFRNSPASGTSCQQWVELAPEPRQGQAKVCAC